MQHAWRFGALAFVAPIPTLSLSACRSANSEAFFVDALDAGGSGGGQVCVGRFEHDQGERQRMEALLLGPTVLQVSHRDAETEEPPGPLQLPLVCGMTRAAVSALDACVAWTED